MAGILSPVLSVKVFLPRDRISQGLKVREGLWEGRGKGGNGG